MFFSDFLHLRPPYIILCVLPWTPVISGAVNLYSVSQIKICFWKLVLVFFKWPYLGPSWAAIFPPGKLMSSTFISTFQECEYVMGTIPKWWQSAAIVSHDRLFLSLDLFLKHLYLVFGSLKFKLLWNQWQFLNTTVLIL